MCILSTRESVFLVIMSISKNGNLFQTYLAEHEYWLQRGQQAGFFLVVGTLSNCEETILIARSCSLITMSRYIASAPFIIEQVMDANVSEINASYLASMNGFKPTQR